MQKKRFLINGLWLTATTLITRAIGIFFRVYMAGSIGAEAIGLYQLILTVYFFAVTFVTSGVTLVVTRLVTEALARGEKGKAKYITVKCLAFSVVLGAFVAAALYMNAGSLGASLLGDERTVLPFKILAPSLPFMAVSACLRGYFYARRTVLKTATEQLLEQVVEIGIFAALVGKMAPMGLTYACCAVAIGTTASEFISCGYSYVLYRLDIRKTKKSAEKIAGFPKKALSIGLPVMVSSCLRSGLSLIENVMIPTGLKKHGSSAGEALEDYGAITGMVMPVITFPAVFLFSFSMLMIPEFSEASSVAGRKAIQYMTSRLLRVVFLFSLPVAVMLFFFAEDLGQMIYGSAKIGTYIAMLAPLVPLMYLDSVVDGMLKGLNQQIYHMTFNIIDSSLRVILIIVLLPKCGIMGLIYVMYVSSILNTGLSLLRLLKVAVIKIKIASWVIKPFASAVVPCVAVQFVCELYAKNFIEVNAVLQMAAVLILYVLILLISKSVEQEEIRWVKTLVKRAR
ncbi:stage V sporulation protein B [Clostridia bacterium]|nr:stage V sporulation protein B [Clostridia bacterium]